MTRTVADFMAEALEQAGVKRVYGIVGDSLNGFTDSLTYETTTRSKPPWVYVRTLTQQEELPLLRDHLLRLDAESRHSRFNGFLDDSFIRSYAARCADDGTVIIA